ncbi:MAG: adhesin, partial [Denitrobacterium sp.]|nr:adhesin [Denitrobacterium sp.]
MTRATNPRNRSDGSLPMRPRPAAKLAASTVALALALGTVPVWAFADDVQAQGAGDTAQTQQAAPPDAGGQAPADGSAPAGDGQAPSAAPAPSGAPGGGADATTFDYSGSYAAEKTADGTSATSTDETISEADADRNAALAQNGGSLVIEGGTLQKSGDGTNDDACNFYGTNAILLAVGDSSTAAVSDSALSASSKGSNGIFATDGATAYASNVSIETTADNSRGLDATYGGTVIAENANITTQGDHSAATATDRGGGNVSVAGGNLNTAGSGSPLVYSTGTIEVDGASGTATGSQIAGMEGANVISIRNSQLASAQSGASGSDPVANGVIVYQSTSGDADTSSGDTARFQAVDSTLSSAIQSGSMFYLTNTRAAIVLQNTELAFDSRAANLLQAEGNNSNNWGSAGS